MALRRRKSSLIPRYSFPYCTRRVVVAEVNEDNPFSNVTEELVFTKGVLEAVTIQTLSEWTLKNTFEGDTTKQAFKVYSNTPLYPSLEATGAIPDSVYLPDEYFTLNGYTAPEGIGGWFNVISAHYRNSNIINHCESVIVKDQYAFTEDGLSQYPSVESLSVITSREDLLNSSVWVSAWLDEEVEVVEEGETDAEV